MDDEPCQEDFMKYVESMDGDEGEDDHEEKDDHEKHDDHDSTKDDEDEGSFFGDLADGLADGVSGVAGGVTDVVSGTADVVTDTAGSVTDVVVETGTGVAGGVGDVVTGTADVVGSAVDTTTGALPIVPTTTLHDDGKGESDSDVHPGFNAAKNMTGYDEYTGDCWFGEDEVSPDVICMADEMVWNKVWYY